MARKLACPIGIYVDPIKPPEGDWGALDGLGMVEDVSGIKFLPRYMGELPLWNRRKAVFDIRIVQNIRFGGLANIILTGRELEKSSKSKQVDATTIGIAYNKLGKWQQRVAVVDTTRSKDSALTVAHETPHLLDFIPITANVHVDTDHCTDRGCIMTAVETYTDGEPDQYDFCELCVTGLRQLARTSPLLV